MGSQIVRSLFANVISCAIAILVARIVFPAASWTLLVVLAALIEFAYFVRWIAS